MAVRRPRKPSRVRRTTRRMIAPPDLDHELVRTDNVKCITLADALRLLGRRRWAVHGNHAQAHSLATRRPIPSRQSAHATGSAETRGASLCRALGWGDRATRRRPHRSRLDPAVRDRARRRRAGCYAEVGTRPARRARTCSGPHLARRPAADRRHLDCALPGLRMCAPGAELSPPEPGAGGCRDCAVGHLRSAHRGAEGPRAGSAFARRCLPAVPTGRSPSHHWRSST